MPQQKIITLTHEIKLRRNAKCQMETGEGDFPPVLKVFNPYGGQTWLFTELDDHGRLFGLCDMGMGEPELGYVMREELEGLRIQRGNCRLPLERDAHFHAVAPLGDYVDAARKAGRIVELAGAGA